MFTLPDAKTWLFSDSHFYHNNIIKYCGRPEDHNDRMWTALNHQVGPEDTLIHLGDVVWHGRSDFQRWVVDLLPGATKILLQGNHDPRRVRNYSGWDHMVKVHEQPFRVQGFDIPILMAHRPQNVPIEENSLVIHGHIPEKGVPVRWEGTSMIVNACVEQWNYGPIPLDNLIDMFKAGT